jgi:hypothetical protein
MEFDKFGGVWGLYDPTPNVDSYHLRHLDYQLINILADVYEASDTDFVYDFTVELDGDGVWYTHQINDALYHLDQAGSVLNSVALNQPRALCGTSDNGCWVIDNSDYYARRYTSSGTMSKSVYLGRTSTRMAADYADGFWYVNGSTVYHVNSEGSTLSTTAVAGVSYIKGMYNGCIIWSEVNDYVKHINSAGVVVRTIAGSSSLTGIPAAFFCSYSSYQSSKIDALPLDDDPVWGINGSAQWKEVRKDGYFLPKDIYHQFELTLRTTVSGNSPSVGRVIMAPIIKIQDIQPQSYKNMYVRTDVPSYVDIGDYETGLKVWWGVEE